MDIKSTTDILRFVKFYLKKKTFPTDMLRIIVLEILQGDWGDKNISWSPLKRTCM